MIHAFTVRRYAGRTDMVTLEYDKPLSDADVTAIADAVNYAVKMNQIGKPDPDLKSNAI